MMGALGLLIGPGIAGGISVLGAATFIFGGNLGGAKLILVARVTCVLVVDVLGTPPLVSFEVPFVSFIVPFVNFIVLLVVVLLNGFFVGAVVGRLLTSFGESLLNGCLLSTVGARGIFGFVVDDFVANKVFGAVGVLGDDISVVLIIGLRGVVIMVLTEADKVVRFVLDAGFDIAFVPVVAFKVVVFGTVVDRTLVISLEVDGAVVGLDNGFDVVDKVVFLRVGAEVLEANSFVGEVFVVVILALDIVVTNFLEVDFLEAKLAAAPPAMATAPTTAAAAISATCNLIND